jgi:hypothetical protein
MRIITTLHTHRSILPFHHRTGRVRPLSTIVEHLPLVSIIDQSRKRRALLNSIDFVSNQLRSFLIWFEMVKKKIDNRIRVLIENGIKTFQRSLIVVVGDKGRDQVTTMLLMKNQRYQPQRFV